VVLKKTAEAVWLAEPFDNPLADGVGVLTLFFKSNILLYSKQEVLADKPFGLVEIGSCRPLK
jgi:hypothetical protein